MKSLCKTKIMNFITQRCKKEIKKMNVEDWASIRLALGLNDKIKYNKNK